MITYPDNKYTNENGVIELISKKDKVWMVEWTKWPHVVYEHELPQTVTVEQLARDYQKVISLEIDDKCSCIKVTC